MTRPFNGRHMSAILVAGFSVVIAVNVFAAIVARQTFGGIVVDNSYAASQDYNRWLEEAAKERALGWVATPRRLADGRIAVDVEGAPEDARIEGEARHPLGRQPDVALRFDAGRVSREVLPAGRWTLRLTVRADGRMVRSESALR